MPSFQYRARDKAGTLFSGILDTTGKEAVAAHLDSLGYYPVSIQEKRQSLNINLSDLRLWFQRIRAEEMIIFSRQMATLVGAGVPILTSFDALAEQTTNPRLKATILTIRKDIEGGSSFSDALARHPSVFSTLYVNMVRAGEAGGVLDEILHRLASLAEHEAETRGRIKSATLHPMIVMVTLLIACFIILTWVIPRFQAIYAKSEVLLPLPTRILIGISTLVQNYGFFVLVACGAAIWGVRRYLQTDSGRLLWDRMKLKLPVFGTIFLKVALSRFARTFGTLTRSGLPVLQTLEIVSGTVGNAAISRVVNSIREAAREGRGVVQPMKESRVFPVSITQMVAIGEETGQMDEMLTKVSEYYDREVDYAIKNLASALEPILLVLIGGVVLILALAVFMPWWNMMSVVKGGIG